MIDSKNINGMKTKFRFLKKIGRETIMYIIKAYNCNEFWRFGDFLTLFHKESLLFINPI